MRSNLELLRLFVEKWKGKFVVNKVCIFFVCVLTYVCVFAYVRVFMLTYVWVCVTYVYLYLRMYIYTKYVVVY